jgi:ABC-type nitrate/sulfonate/bicarbonate transport system substrate-binding protein
LKGKTIAAGVANSTGFLVSKYLETAGLTMNDVVINDIPTAGYIDSFNTKSVDAISAPELWVTRLLKAGNAVTLVGVQDVVGKVQLSVLVFGKSLMVDHPDIGVRFLAAYLKGVADYNQGKTESNVQILADATGEDAASLQDSCWPSIREDATIDFAGIEPYQQWAIDMKYLDTPITEAQFWDPSFLAAAQKLLGH